MTRRTVEFGCAVVVIGLLAGVAGAATTLLLHAVEHLTYRYSFGTLLTGVDRPIPRLAMSLDAGLQVLLVGSGASLGREGAPRQLAAAWGDLGTSR
ncbi:MAG: chloride channel protein, partial [Mycobacterium sp.]